MGIDDDRDLLGISKNLDILYFDSSKGTPTLSKKQNTDLTVRKEIENLRAGSGMPDAESSGDAKSIQPGTFRETAKLALSLYKEQDRETYKLTGCEFTPQPNESGPDEGMAYGVVNTMMTYDKLNKWLKAPKEGLTMHEAAEVKATEERLDTIKDIITCWFTVNGLNPTDNREITEEQMAAAAKAFPGKLKKYQKIVVDWDHRVMELLAEEVKNTESYKKALLERAGKTEETLKKRMTEGMEYLKKAAKSENQREVISKKLLEKVASDIKISMKKEDEYVCSMNTMLENPEFSGMEDVIREHFRVALNLVSFIAECVEQFLKYVVDDEEPDMLHGNYIRLVWGADCNRIEPLKPLKGQLEMIDDRLGGFTEYDLSAYPVTYLVQGRLEESKAIKHEKMPADTLEDLKNRCEALMKKKDEYPDLFVEPGVIRLFKHIPEMIELFEEAKGLRSDMSIFADEKVGKLKDSEKDKFKDIYALCSAFYDTLLTRHMYVVFLSRMMLPEIIDAKMSIKTAAFEYCLKESREYVERGVIMTKS